MKTEDKSDWIVVVYSDGEKVGSRSWRKKTENEVNKETKIWIDKFHSGRDWSLHKSIPYGKN